VLTAKALRVQYSGAVTLAQYEHFAEILRETRRRAAAMNESSLAAEAARAAAEDKMAALALQYEGLKVRATTNVSRVYLTSSGCFNSMGLVYIFVCAVYQTLNALFP
jgi:hypothetical protein